ncbi:hypothetical protein JL720_16201 [Aureococcus anophagefferens]|nr:hypothetical protein JL720_16201 [Aureococcus anophagefferens]
MAAQITARIGRIVAVTSCKGGVGKSTVSFELAKRLAARGLRVGVFDADVYGPSLPTQVPGDVSARGVAASADGWTMEPAAHDSLALMSFGWLGRLMGESDGEVIDQRRWHRWRAQRAAAAHDGLGRSGLPRRRHAAGHGRDPRALAARARFSARSS